MKEIDWPAQSLWRYSKTTIQRLRFVSFSPPFFRFLTWKYVFGLHLVSSFLSSYCYVCITWWQCSTTPNSIADYDVIIWGETLWTLLGTLTFSALNSLWIHLATKKYTTPYMGRGNYLTFFMTSYVLSNSPIFLSLYTWHVYLQHIEHRMVVVELEIGQYTMISRKT